MTIKRHAATNSNGLLIITGPDIKGGVVEIDTLQCVHCGCHWQVQPGSGMIRGFCGRCNGPVCGPKCKECVPMELELEIIEGTKTGTEVSVLVKWQGIGTSVKGLGTSVKGLGTRE